MFIYLQVEMDRATIKQSRLYLFFFCGRRFLQVSLVLGLSMQNIFLHNLLESL